MSVLKLFSSIFFLCFLFAGLAVHISGCLPDASDVLISSYGGDSSSRYGDKSIDELLDENTDTKKVADSDMEIVFSGEPAYNAFYDLIASAKDNINIETFQFDNDSYQLEDTGMEFIDLLISKAKEGVCVNVILDPLAQTFNSLLTRAKKLESGGVNVVYYDAPGKKGVDRVYFRTHKKILVVDGRKAIIGGMNFGFLFFGVGQWRDTGVLLTGPVVKSVQDDFFRDWVSLGRKIPSGRQFYPKLKATGNFGIRVIDQRPAQNDLDINEAVKIALDKAEYSVDIEAPYFNPSDWLVREIARARTRGVRIRILTNSHESDDIMLSYTNTAYWFEPMLRLGVEMYLWDVPHKTMHSKAIVVDDKFAMIGSYNFNIRSIMWDAEEAAIFTNKQAVERVRQMLEDDFDSDYAFKITQKWIDEHRTEKDWSWDIWHRLTGWFM